MLNPSFPFCPRTVARRVTEYQYGVKMSAANMSLCGDTSDALELFEPQGLWLKPIAKLNISVQLPQLKTPGKSISNWEVMEKLRHLIKPDQFIILKVAKNTLEFIRFEGEIENKNLIKTLISRLDGKTIKLSGFPDTLKVRAAETKLSFPSRYDWDSYFRDAKNMNEMKPGERPDTIHFKDLPSRWFANKKDHDKDKPSEYILKKVLESFGEIRCVDIPMLDPYRKETTAAGAIQTFNFGQDLNFEAFVQYTEYIGFVKAMTALRGMKLMYKGDDGKAFTAATKIDFDKTKHLSEKNIKKRRLERERLEQLEREREDRVRKERDVEEKRKAEERRQREEEERDRERRREEKQRKKEARLKAREERRKQRRLEKKQRAEEKAMQKRIMLEERKILIAQRKLETIRLLSVLFSRIKIIRQQEELERRERELQDERVREVEHEKRKQLEAEKRKLDNEKKKMERLEKQEKELREKILKNIRAAEVRRTERDRESLRQKLSGSKKLKSTIVMKK